MIPSITPTQRKAVDRSQAFRASIAQKAAELKAAKNRECDISPPIKALAPEAFPAEPDPPGFQPSMIWPAIPPTKDRESVVYRVADIQEHVCRYYNVSKLSLLSPRRLGHLVYPRQVAVYLVKELTARSMPDIGRRFGGRDHTTVLHSVRKIARQMLTDENLAFEISQLIEIITGEQNPEFVQPPRSRLVPGGNEMKRTFYANLYRPFAGSCGHVYESQELADQMAARDRLVCVPFTVEMPGEQRASNKSEQPSD